jgi:hypothetical protein
MPAPIYLPQQPGFMEQFLKTGALNNILQSIMMGVQNRRADEETSRGYLDKGYTETTPMTPSEQAAAPQNPAERAAFEQGPRGQYWQQRVPDVTVGGGRGLMGTPQRGFRKPPEVEYDAKVETFKGENGEKYNFLIKRTKDGKFVAAQNVPATALPSGTRKKRDRLDKKTGMTFRQEYIVDKSGKETWTGPWTTYKDPSSSATNIFIGTGPGGKPLIMSSKGKPNIRTADVPGGSAINPKTTARLSSEQQKAISDLGDIERIATEVEKEFDPNFVGPVVGRARGISSKFVSDPKFTSFKNKASQLRAVVYGLSGKQINEAELKWLKEDILPALSQPSANYKATLKVLKEWVAKKKTATAKAFSEQGYIVGGQQEVVPPNGRKPLSSF